MNSEEISQIINKVRDGEYSTLCNVDFESLFKEYSKFQINNKSNFKESTNDFYSFVKNIKPEFNLTKVADENFDRKLEAFCRFARISLCRIDHLKSDDMYLKLVKKLSPNGDNTKLLEVGAGEVPYSSINLAQSFNPEISSMDKSFLLSKESLKTFKINAIEEYFTRRTQIDNVDMVIGQRPCSAIENVVMSCCEENKPYLLETCNCDISKSPFYKCGATWQDILPNYDDNIKFVNNFAFNCDATEAQVSKICEECSFNNIK